MALRDKEDKLVDAFPASDRGEHCGDAPGGRGHATCQASRGRAQCQLRSPAVGRQAQGHPQCRTNSLERGIVALEVAIKTLGRIRTVFENTRVYWTVVQTHCAELTDLDQVTSLCEIDGVEAEIAEMITTDSWYLWLALSKINYTAARSMESVIGKIDGVMCDLPTRAEVNARFPALIERLEQVLIEETIKLENEERLE